jgi:hypothetical protein
VATRGGGVGAAALGAAESVEGVASAVVVASPLACGDDSTEVDIDTVTDETAAAGVEGGGGEDVVPRSRQLSPLEASVITVMERVEKLLAAPTATEMAIRLLRTNRNAVFAETAAQTDAVADVASKLAEIEAQVAKKDEMIQRLLTLNDMYKNKCVRLESQMKEFEAQKKA